MRLRMAIRALMLIAAIYFMSVFEKPVRARDVSLDVRTKDGRSEYHIGEPIALQIVFASTNKQYIAIPRSKVVRTIS
jgi:hypothetical protein